MILKINTRDIRYKLPAGAGSDAIHHNPIYAYAVTELIDDTGIIGTGLAFTLGNGNDLVCQASKYYAEQLRGKDIEELMANYGVQFKAFANDPQLRWLGPHKGVVQLALASVTNACFDLWAKKRGLPLWKLLIELSPVELLNTIDFSNLEDEIQYDEALAILTLSKSGAASKHEILITGYPAYDTSAGWFNYSDDQIADNCKKALQDGFRALKLKVGSVDSDRDIRRANIVRKTVGNSVKIMLDANQQWSLPQAKNICEKLQNINPYWIEEPLHPDDVFAHQKLSQSLPSLKFAIGEHVPNSVVFKNYLQTGAVSFIQVDALRVGGASEFIMVSLLCKKFGIPVVPHVGDMGQIHQHLVLFNHIALEHSALFLEHIPHLQHYFLHPAIVKDGFYLIPEQPGSSCDLIIQ